MMKVSPLGCIIMIIVGIPIMVVMLALRLIDGIINTFGGKSTLSMWFLQKVFMLFMKLRGQQNPFGGGNPFGAGGNPFGAGANPFGQQQTNTRSNAKTTTSKPKNNKKLYHDNDGEYVEFEEVKE
ncbi:MAG: DUF4834 family protein [Bacteroidales bacterium]|nr:DUF4834 family protein [Candidatus Minthousia equi]